VSKKARPRRRQGDAGPDAIWNYDPKRRVSELIGQLLNVPGPANIADVELGENADDIVDDASVSEFEMKAVVVGAKEANDLDIAAGKEDLASYFPGLLDSIDAIPDSVERDRAYDALYFVVNATYRIARSIDPLNELQRSLEKQVVAMLARKEKKRVEREKIVLSLIDERERRGKPSSWLALKPRLDELFVGKKLGEISGRTFYRIKRQRKKISATLEG
jgi:hypothetical protein